MKDLTAREYLRQLEDINIYLEQDIQRLNDMQCNAMCPGGIDYSKDRVQTSPDDQLSNTVIGCVQLQETLKSKIAKYYEMQTKIIDQIRGLHDSNYNQVLYKVYVEFKSIRTTALEMHRSYSYVIELHKKALKSFEETYQNLTYLI